MGVGDCARGVVEGYLGIRRTCYLRVKGDGGVPQPGPRNLTHSAFGMLLDLYQYVF